MRLLLFGSLHPLRLTLTVPASVQSRLTAAALASFECGVRCPHVEPADWSDRPEVPLWCVRVTVWYAAARVTLISFSE